MNAIKLSALLFLAISTQLVADDTEGQLNLEQLLLMPGKVSSAHADIETKCTSCHVHFEKDNQSPLCIDCHELVAGELDKKIGFHGQLSQVQKNSCNTCHTEHMGRKFDITGLDKDLFDHSKTNFLIVGKHLGVSCATCHTNLTAKAKSNILPVGIKSLPTDKAFRFKEFRCDSCHENYHKQKLGDKCEDCHSEKAWQTTAFDHDKTDFKLVGPHKQAVCVSCHVDNQFKKINSECKSCHLAVDSHLGIMGEQCEDCHSVKKWQNSSFEHSIDTKYKLIGKHRKVNCISCHATELKPAKQCIDCHISMDIHQGINGKNCQDCHSQKDWAKTDFTHDPVLTGKHLDLSCDLCHTPGEKREKIIEQRNCIDCHQAIDPHLGKLGENCASCHQTEDWKESVIFNHDFTDFPLTASHQLLVCGTCHLSAQFSSLSKDCVSCHNKDDYHEKSLGDKCASCHDTSVWSHWQFDHDQQTDFEMTGSHRNLQCGLCHNQSKTKPLKPATKCISCHLDDDIHTGGFGLNCQHCHSTERFDESTF